MSLVVLADLRAKGGSVSKDTVAGGYGSRFRGDSVTTRFAKNVRRVFLNLPSIHVGYLAAIFSQAGHKVVVTSDHKPIPGDLALVLTSLVDYRHERAWGNAARSRGLRVGFFGTPATHLPELFIDTGDFVIAGEPEAAAIRLAAGEDLHGLVKSPAIDDLDSLPFPRWDLVKGKRFGYTNHRRIGLTRAVPMLTSRSCPEHCTYCPIVLRQAFGSAASRMSQLKWRSCAACIISRTLRCGIHFLRSIAIVASISPKRFARASSSCRSNARRGWMIWMKGLSEPCMPPVCAKSHLAWSHPTRWC